MTLSTWRPTGSPQKKVRLTVELTEAQMGLLVGLVRRQASEAALGWSFAMRNGAVAQATERRVSTWTEIMSILAASAEEAQEVE